LHSTVLRSLAAFTLPVTLAFAACAQSSDALKLNQIQVIGTHNSYHAGIAPNETKVWQTRLLSVL
jgi:hypothetical protein